MRIFSVTEKRIKNEAVSDYLLWQVPRLHLYTETELDHPRQASRTSVRVAQLPVGADDESEQNTWTT